MNTLLLSSQCDSCAAKLLVKYLTCSPANADIGFSWDETLITSIICATVIIVALIFRPVITNKIKKDGKNSDGTSGNGASQEKDNTIKYVEKLTDFLLSQTKVYGEKGEITKYKDADAPECVMYREVLAYLIDAQQKDDKKINIVELKAVLQQKDNNKEENNKK